MPDPSQRIDPRSFPILGLLGVVACGPVAPQGGETDATSDGSDSTSAGPGTDPTTEPPDPTRPTTTEPMPECRLDSDCDDVYCGYCSEGRCRESVGCCDDYAGNVVGNKWRCSPPPYYDCYNDRDCEDGDLCVGGECVAGPPIALPSCVPRHVDVAPWNLSDAPSAFVLADLDGDLDLDLAAAEPASGSIEIALNDGAGNFVLAGAFGVAPGATGELALAAGDIDKDGDLDLVVTRREVDGVLNLLFNDGAVFTVGPPQFIAEQPVQVFMADLNGDGALDVLSLNEVWPHISVQIGDGAGQLSAKQSGIDETFAGRAQVADINLDGVADLLAPNFGKVTLWLGGPAPLLSPLHDFPAGGAAVAALSADLDLQGLSDVVLLYPQREQGVVEVWSGTAKEAWAFEPQRFITSVLPTGGILAEIDDIPGPDLVSATSDGRLMVLPGNGGDGFACEHIVDAAPTTTPASIAVGDIDNDGRLEILSGGPGAPAITTTRLTF